MNHGPSQPRRAEYGGDGSTDNLPLANQAAINLAPLVGQSGMPAADRSDNQRGHGPSCGQCPGHALAGEWLDVASRIADQKQSLRCQPPRAPRQRRRAAPVQLGQVRHGGPTNLGEQFDGSVPWTAMSPNPTRIERGGQVEPVVFETDQSQVTRTPASHEDYAGRIKGRSRGRDDAHADARPRFRRDLTDTAPRYQIATQPVGREYDTRRHAFARLLLPQFHPA